jgi:hypothetical protein
MPASTQPLPMIVICLFVCATAVAQPAGIAADSMFQKAFQHSYQLYADSLKQHLHIFQGTEYTARYPDNKGSAYLSAKGFTPGTVCSRGIIYYQIPMDYDMVTDDLVVLNPYQNLPVIPHRQAISWFEIDHVRFVQLPMDRQTANIVPGFYQELCSGKVSAYVRRIRSSAANATLYELADFVELSSYQIFNGGHYYKISNKASLIKACMPWQKKVSAYYKQQNLNYKKNAAAVVTQVVKYLNTINQ